MASVGVVKRIAVAGGIGSGKTAVTDYLASRHGAWIVDADLVAREILDPGTPSYHAVIDAFGTSVVSTSGSIHREILAEIVFTNDAARKRLNSITHPAIGVEILHRLESSPDVTLAVVALPLFRPFHREAFALNEVWCVVTSPDEALRRLTEFRSFSPDDALSRIRSQMTASEMSILCDEVIANDGTLEELHVTVDDLVAKLGK
ncbi:MAG: dephospho-CoA kinase [Actinomycetota bacterium]|jgi:dephospho-CoA kinase